MDPFQETTEHVSLSRLIAHYADAVSRRAWDEFDELFLPDAPITVDTVTAPAYELVGPRAIGEFIASAITRFSFFEFVVLNFRSMFDPARPDAATGRLYMSELRQSDATDRQFSPEERTTLAEGRPSQHRQFSPEERTTLAEGRPSQHRQFSIAFGVYHDHFARTADGWRFSRRHYQSLNRQPSGEVFPFPTPPGF